jgi:hypothetical protein
MRRSRCLAGKRTSQAAQVDIKTPLLTASARLCSRLSSGLGRGELAGYAARDQASGHTEEKAFRLLGRKHFQRSNINVHSYLTSFLTAGIYPPERNAALPGGSHTAGPPGRIPGSSTFTTRGIPSSMYSN